MRTKFINAVKTHQVEFGLELTASKIDLLADFYETIQESNDLLHLVAPSSVDEFVIRHILESLILLEFLPENARFADIGPGAGLPSIPCLIVREDLQCVLIESKLKKASFLETVVEKFGFETRAQIINYQVEEARFPETSFVSCRALDKFTRKLPKLIKWSGKSTLLLFGGNSMRDELEMSKVKFEENLIPMSAQRFLFIAKS